MPLVDMRDLLQHARDNRYAVAAFNIANLDSLDLVVTAAERCQAPVVLAIDARLFRSGRRARHLLAAMVAAASDTEAPTALYLNGRASPDTLVEAIRRGCNGVCIDAGDEKAAGAAMALLRDTGVAIALASAGTLSREFIESRAPDFLAQPSGDGEPGPSSARPWILRNGDAWPADRIAQWIAGGVALIDHPEPPASADDAEDRMRRCGGGRAQAVLAQCRPWAPVEHLIVYNVEGADEHDVESMMATGRTRLGAIPGVLEVFTGRALTEQPKYRYCWLVRFTHPTVIRSYAAHPDHVAFANELFRPIAGDRITIDYQAVMSSSGTRDS